MIEFDKLSEPEKNAFLGQFRLQSYLSNIADIEYMCYYLKVDYGEFWDMFLWKSKSVPKRYKTCFLCDKQFIAKNDESDYLCESCLEKNYYNKLKDLPKHKFLSPEDKKNAV